MDQSSQTNPMPSQPVPAQDQLVVPPPSEPVIKSKTPFVVAIFIAVILIIGSVIGIAMIGGYQQKKLQEPPRTEDAAPAAPTSMQPTSSPSIANSPALYPTATPKVVITSAQTNTPTPKPTPTPTPRPPTATPIPTATSTPIPTPTRTPNPPGINISYPQEGQTITQASPQICVTDYPTYGDNTGDVRKQNINNTGWTGYSSMSTLCFNAVTGANTFSLQYKNAYGEESSVYTRNFTYQP